MNPDPKHTHHKNAVIKSELRRTGKVELDLDDQFFDRLHDKIMAQVEETTMVPKPHPVKKLKNYLWSKPWRRTLLSREGFAVYLLVFGLTYQSAQSSIYFQWMKYQTREENILAQALESPDLLHNLTDARPQSDFFVDVANHSMNDFDYDQLKQVLWQSAESESETQ
ncbi:MAG: hypothetical protein ACK5P5_01100 [Pseudobdellovibrionaceae bacterium]|jgi:hypothetical protein